MPLSDLDQALLDLALKRGAITDARAQELRAAVERAGGPDFDTAIGEAVDPERLRELCRDLPAFYAERRKARRTQHSTRTVPAPKSAPTAPSASVPSAPRAQSTPPPKTARNDDRTLHASEVAGSLSRPASPESATKLAELARALGGPSSDVDRIGPYAIERELGRGGLGVVYRARRDGETRDVALKLLSLEGDAIAARRFVREVRALAKVDHPNVVKIYDCDQTKGKLYYAMELLDGAPLADVIEEKGALAPAAVARISRDCLAGLGAIHAHGILHRDVKPANILIERSGRAVIIDFSVASLPDASLVLTQQGFAVGTPMFMAPEQVRGDPTGPATDLYSLGISLWLALEGRSPYGKDLETYEALADAKLGNPPPKVTRPNVPRALSLLIERLMATEPKDRFASGEEAIAFYDDALAREPAPAKISSEKTAGEKTVGESTVAFEKLGKFELLATVGKGAHGTVYRARDSQGREVALKVLDQGAEASSLARLTHESRVLARIQHENVARIHGAGIVNEKSFLALEWVDGGTLEDLCRSSGALPLEAVLAIGTQIARALEAAHAQKVVHRDLKPENILVSRTGDVKLADFGLARIEDEPETSKALFQGTPAYAAPEQSKGEAATRRSDLYALGGILFRMAAGRKPFEADSAAALAYKHLREPAPRLDSVRPDAGPLGPIVAALLDKDPEKRYASADDLARDLALLADGKPPLALPGGVSGADKKGWWRVW